jgi:hypothetical protein
VLDAAPAMVEDLVGQLPVFCAMKGDDHRP